MTEEKKNSQKSPLQEEVDRLTNLLRLSNTATFNHHLLTAIWDLTEAVKLISETNKNGFNAIGPMLEGLSQFKPTEEKEPDFTKEEEEEEEKDDDPIF